MFFTKRKKFVITSIVLSLGILTTQLVSLEWRYLVISGLSFLSVILTLWGLRADLKGIGWLMAVILPALYPASISLFYFLLPEKLLTRIVMLVLFAIGMYAILLTENIFIVASLRTIQLARAAQAVGFLFTLLIAFFLLDTVFSFKLAPWWNGLGVLVITFPLFLQGMWSVDLSDKLTAQVINMALVLSFALMQLGLVISIWPVGIGVASLFLVTAIYISLGLGQHHLTGRLFQKTINEYVQVALAVMVITFLTAHWGG